MTDHVTEHVTGEPVTLTVEEDQGGLRLDQFLSQRMDGTSRSRLKQIIKQGGVARNGATIMDPSCKVKQDEVFVLIAPAPIAANPEPEDISLDVIFEDEHLIVINKPAGLVVHPAAGHWSGTLVNALLHHCAGSLSGIGGVLRPGIVHRLDKDTSGVMVATKHDRAHNGLAEQFAAHSLERAYQAIVWGAPRPLKGTVDVPIARGGGDRQKMAVVRPSETREGKRAVTHYHVLKRYGDEAAPTASLVECRLETGRTHQIRVHMSHLGHPVLGDPLYGRGRQFLSARAAAGNEEAVKTVAAFRRQALHAYLLGFEHPITAETLRFECPLPNDLVNLACTLELL